MLGFTALTNWSFAYIYVTLPTIPTNEQLHPQTLQLDRVYHRSRYSVAVEEPSRNKGQAHKGRMSNLFQKNSRYPTSWTMRMEPRWKV